MIGFILRNFIEFDLKTLGFPGGSVVKLPANAGDTAGARAPVEHKGAQSPSQLRKPMHLRACAQPQESHFSEKLMHRN